jgi:hypothetical protein
MPGAVPRWRRSPTAAARQAAEYNPVPDTTLMPTDLHLLGDDT